jgi:hypothetical protein
LKKLNILFAKLYMAALELPGIKKDNRRHWATSARITTGHHDNFDQMSAQVNFSKVGKTTEV